MMISGTACHVQHDTHLATGMLRLTLIQRGVFFMAHIQYSITDLYSQEPLERLLYISSATYGNDWISMFHSHSFAELFYVLDGQGHFCTESEEVPIERDSLILINPNIRHTEKSSVTHPLTYIVLGLDNLHFQFSGTEYGAYRVHDFYKHRDACLPIMQMMLDEARGRRTSSELICHHFLSILLLKILRISGDQFTPYSSKNIPGECETLKCYIDTHYQENITLDKLAEVSHLNKFYLSHLFNHAFGISPITYLLERRILHSKELLKSTDFSITQIAHTTGFSSANYFSQSFKRYTGLPPASYRKNHQDT